MAAGLRDGGRVQHGVKSGPVGGGDHTRLGSHSLVAQPGLSECVVRVKHIHSKEILAIQLGVNTVVVSAHAHCFLSASLCRRSCFR